MSQVLARAADLESPIVLWVICSMLLNRVGTAAKALGLTIPESFLLRADEVIQ